MLDRDMHDPAVLVDGEVDFPMPRHVFKGGFHIRLLHEAELQGDAYDAGILVITITPETARP